jgi:hypothetical protein
VGRPTIEGGLSSGDTERYPVALGARSEKLRGPLIRPGNLLFGLDLECRIRSRQVQEVMVGQKFVELDEIGTLAQQHQYDELRQLYNSHLRGWSPSSTPHFIVVNCVVMSLVDDGVAECRQDVCAKLHHCVGVGR